MAEQQESSSSSSSSAAPASTCDDDAILARRLAAVEQLTALFGFDEPAATTAVDAVGPDVAACCEYILDNTVGVMDRGGPVTPLDSCPHVEQHVRLAVDDIPAHPHALPCSFFLDASCNDTSCRLAATTTAARPKAELVEDGTCPAGENWMCLECGLVRCGRYVNGHGVQHWQETQQQQQQQQQAIGSAASSGSTTTASAALTPGHCIAVSLADLSVWCHVCRAYLRPAQTPMEPLVQRLEQLKFAPDDSDDDNHHEDKNDHDMVVDRPTLDDDEPDRKRARSAQSSDSSESTGRDEDQHERQPEERVGSNTSSSDNEEDDDGDDSDSDQEDSDAQSQAENNNHVQGPTAVSDLDGMDDGALMRLLESVANARGIPLSFLIQQVQAENDDDDDDDDEYVEYPFETLPTNLQQVADFIVSDKCRKILVLAGAGMSVSSGIPDYRSADGFYANLQAEKITATPAEQQAIRVDPTVALQQPFFLQNPLPCLELKRDFILGTHQHRWKATLAHRFVELLHRKTGKLARLYTQNIDGLEDQLDDLPRQKVIPVHGSMDRAECASCGAVADFNAFCEQVATHVKDLTGQDASAPAHSRPIVCAECGAGTMKPAIVLFMSRLPAVFFDSVPTDIQDVDLLIVLGTSLAVAPANSLVWRVPKSCLRVLINRERVGKHLGMHFGDDDYSNIKRDFHAAGDCEDVVLELMEHLGWIQELGPLAMREELPESSAEKLRECLSRLSSA